MCAALPQGKIAHENVAAADPFDDSDPIQQASAIAKGPCESQGYFEPFAGRWIWKRFSTGTPESL
jgi:hypothetical protein